MADEDRPYASGFSGSQQSVLRNHLSGGQIVSGLDDQQPLGMTSPAHFTEVSSITGGSALAMGMQNHRSTADQNHHQTQEAVAHQQQRHCHQHQLHQEQEMRQLQHQHHQEQELQQLQQHRQKQELHQLQQQHHLHQEQEPRQHQQHNQHHPEQDQHQQRGQGTYQNNCEASQPDTSQIPLFQAPPLNQQQKKGPTTVFICRLGQECIDDIYTQAFEIFHYLKDLPLPNGTAQVGRIAHDKKLQLQEKLRIMKLKFKQLHRIFDKCNENCQSQGMEYVDIESLVPLKEVCESKSDDKKVSETDRLAFEERERIIEEIVAKNREIKDIIYHLRRLVFEVNVMLEMRLT